MANIYGRQVVVPLTNKSGGGVVAGDVVIIDTANNDAFTTTTSSASTAIIGVAQETIANNASGRVLTGGYAALVNVNASVTRGHYGTTHTVAKQATDAGASRAAGTFCQFLTGGTTPDAVVWPSDSGAGGGGAPTTSKYVTSAADGTLSAEIVIPGMAGSVDIAGGGGSDDEFDQNTSGTPSGWTAFNAPDTVNTQTLSQLYLKANAAAGDNIKGIYKAVPSIPFTVTAKMNDFFVKANYTGAGLMLLDGTPTKLLTIGAAMNVTERYGGTNWTNKTTVSGGAGTDYVCTPWPNTYLRFVVNSSSNIDLYVSRGGRVWRSLGLAFNPSFTVANVGLYVNSNNASDAGEAYFDWIRFA